MIGYQTRYLGIVGNPLEHSLSPLLHNKTLRHMGMDCVYLPFEIPSDQLRAALIGVRGLGIQGLNVTIPYKEMVIPYLDGLSPEAAGCGSVNVIANREGQLIGHNTDGRGFLRALEEHCVAIQGCALVIGCGGAARAIVYSLATAGLKQAILMDIDEQRADALADFIRERTPCLAESYPFNQRKFNEVAVRANIVVNCTPVGMYPHIAQSPVKSLTTLQPDTVVCDIIYNPAQTSFLTLARRNGFPVVGGIDMFVHQAAMTLELLLDAAPPLGYMKEVVLHALR